MPNLNIKEPGGFEELPATPKPSKPQRERGGGISPVIIIVGVVVLLAVGVYLLNTFGIVHLWGEKKPAQVTQELPPPVPAEEQPAVADTYAAPPPQVSEPPAETQPTARRRPQPSEGAGTYAYQVSSWQTMSKAQQEADELKNAGFNAFVDEVTKDGITWYRVRIGYYGTAAEAKQAADEFALNWESGYYVARVKQ